MRLKYLFRKSSSLKSKNSDGQKTKGGENVLVKSPREGRLLAAIAADSIDNKSNRHSGATATTDESCDSAATGDGSLRSLLERTQIHVVSQREGSSETISLSSHHTPLRESREPGDNMSTSTNSTSTSSLTNTQSQPLPNRSRELDWADFTEESIECIFEGEQQECTFANILVRPQQEQEIPDRVLLQSSSMSTYEDAVTATPPTETDHCLGQQKCTCGLAGHHRLPPLDTTLWPQAPLLFRPQPGSGTRVKGIRKDGTSEYLWKAQDEEGAARNVPWWQRLQQEWGVPPGSSEPAVIPCCSQCVILPINNGNEAEGESLVVDFETDYFKGSIMIRLRFAEGTTPAAYNDEIGYFGDKPLRYQATIRGRFQKEMPFSELVSGQYFERPCGKLPPKWVMWTARKVLHFFAPQLTTKLDCAAPYTHSPLGSAASTFTVDGNKDPFAVMGMERVEPTTAQNSVTGKAYNIANSWDRARARKKKMDQLYTSKSATPTTDPSKTFTMEFLQHLFDYQNFQIDLSGAHLNVCELLDGQPLQIAAACGEGNNGPSSKLWAFELWNTSLMADAKKHV